MVMNPLVIVMMQKIEESRKNELIVLEELLNEECKCESAHKYTVCAGEVTHISGRTCKPGWTKVCINTATFNLRTMEDPHAICATCGFPCQDCWKLIPV